MVAIIGREPGTSMPRLCIKCGSQTKYLGQPGSVPKTVSRNHCRIELSSDSKIKVDNISDQNSVFVNGLECQVKIIDKSDLVELGADHYRLDVEAVLKTITALDGPKTYNIAHLKTIWDNYSREKMEIQVNERKNRALNPISGALSMAGILLSFIPSLSSLRVVFLVIGLSCLVFFIWLNYKNATAIPEKQKEIDDRFTDDYVCPNQQCRHYLGNKSYKLILKDGYCPWCKSKFIE